LDDSTVLPRLMLVTDRRRVRARNLVEWIAEAVGGGVGIVQLREKDLPDDELRELVVRVRDAVPESTCVVVNSSERVARTQKTGLHLPAAATTPRVLLEGLRPFRPFGRSVHDEKEAARAMRDRPDYLVLGHIYRSASKPGSPGRGLGLLDAVCRAVAPVPVFAIGGVTVGRIPEVIHGGAYGVAVCGPILTSNDPRRVAQAMSLALEVAVGRV